MANAFQTTGHCDNCDSAVPPGCRHIFGDQEECKLGPRTDLAWRIGLAIWRDLTDRRGIKHELESLDEDIQVKIIETMGNLAEAEIGKA